MQELFLNYVLLLLLFYFKISIFISSVTKVQRGFYPRDRDVISILVSSCS